jgi:hypothetical protein
MVLCKRTLGRAATLFASAVSITKPIVFNEFMGALSLALEFAGKKYDKNK